MPSDMTVVPLTLGHTAELVCAVPAEVDEPEPDAPLAMPAMPGIDVDPEDPAGPEVLDESELELEPEPGPAPFDAGADATAEGAAEELVAGCDVASTAVVAASTRTAAVATVPRATHQSRAAVPMADAFSDHRCLSLPMAHSSRVLD